jgi:hypothetical protein
VKGQQAPMFAEEWPSEAFSHWMKCLELRTFGNWNAWFIAEGILAVKKILVVSLLAVLVNSGAQVNAAVTRQKALDVKDSFRPSDVKVLGDIKYGQSIGPKLCAVTPRYTAYVFNGNGGDRIEVTAKGEGATYVAIADSSLVPIAGGSEHLVLTLSTRGPDVEAFYIVFRPEASGSARVTIQLKKLAETSEKPADRPSR